MSDQDSRDALLDAAQALFFNRGYEATTEQAIEAEAGAGAGSFAACFATKLAAAEALALRMGEPLQGLIEPILEDEALSALEKLNAFFDISASWKWGQAEMVRQVVRGLALEGNLTLIQITGTVLMGLYQPMLAQIISQGQAEGVLDVEEPADTAELILQLSTTLRSTIAALVLELEEQPWTFKVIERKTRLFITATERILGAPKGSLRHMDIGYLEALVCQEP
jgi:AcrR family transcriptional regulator